MLQVVSSGKVLMWRGLFGKIIKNIVDFAITLFLLSTPLLIYVHKSCGKEVGDKRTDQVGTIDTFAQEVKISHYAE